MSVTEETRRLRQTLFKLELIELSARVDAIERRIAILFGAAHHPASKRHDEIMEAIARIADFDGLRKRIARIEAREGVSWRS
jgi:glucan phosphorylase